MSDQWCYAHRDSLQMLSVLFQNRYMLCAFLRQAVGEMCVRSK